jgi:hypothetical protein
MEGHPAIQDLTWIQKPIRSEAPYRNSAGGKTARRCRASERVGGQFTRNWIRVSATYLTVRLAVAVWTSAPDFAVMVNVNVP